MNSRRMACSCCWILLPCILDFIYKYDHVLVRVILKADRSSALLTPIDLVSKLTGPSNDRILNGHLESQVLLHMNSKQQRCSLNSIEHISEVEKVIQMSYVVEFEIHTGYTRTNNDTTTHPHLSTQSTTSFQQQAIPSPKFQQFTHESANLNDLRTTPDHEPRSTIPAIASHSETLPSLDKLASL